MVDFHKVMITKGTRKWSPQQQAFIDWCDTGVGSCVLIAGAGCGKSTTLEAGARKLSARGKRVAVVCFNRKINKEMKEKCQDDRNIWCGTVHSFGNRALKRGIHQLKDAEPNKHKVRDLFDEVLLPKVTLESADIAIRLGMSRDAVVQLVSLAKQRAVIGHEINDKNEWLEIIEHFDLVDDDDPMSALEVARYARLLLKLSNDKRDAYDFDDMIYFPLQLALSFPKFDVVMIDEAQDTNPSRRLVVRRMLKPGGRVIAVGDPRQAIYGFTGADNDALDVIIKEFRAITLPLTTTYRCPKSVVEFASQWVGNHLTAHESAPEGVVSSCDWPTFLAAMKGKAANGISLGDTFVLCRNNAPLVAAGFNLIRNRVPCKIEGRDIGDGLKKLANKWKVKSLDTLTERLDAYLVKQTERFKKNEVKLAQVVDQVETIKVIIDQCQLEGKRSVADVIAYIDDMFADDVSGMLTLCSIHRSKGLERETVYWLDRHSTCPSKFAKKDWQKDQEVNLMYVAATRAKSNLIDLDPMPRDAGAMIARQNDKRALEAAARGINAELGARIADVTPEEALTPVKLSDDEKRAKRNADKARRAKARRDAKKNA